MTTIGEDLPKEMARVRDEVLPFYGLPEFKGMGRYASEMIKSDLDAAANALAEGDIAKMIHAYESLKGYHT